MRLFYLLSCILLPSIAIAESLEYQLDNDSRLLARCDSAFAYGVNYFMLQDNEGAAKIMAFQQARAMTALFALHYENGVVPGYKVRAFKIEGRSVNPELSKGPEQFSRVVDDCIPAVTEVIQRTNVRHVRMWGKNFGELIEWTAERIRAAVGLN